MDIDLYSKLTDYKPHMNYLKVLGLEIELVEYFGQVVAVIENNK